jgi:hypothetical protein
MKVIELHSQGRRANGVSMYAPQVPEDQGQRMPTRFGPVHSAPVYNIRSGSTKIPVTRRELMESVRAEERNIIKRGTTEAAGHPAFDMGDIGPPPNISGDNEGLEPMKPPTSVADVATAFLDYSTSILSKANLSPNQTMPLAVGLTFYERHNIGIGMEWIFKICALSMSEKGSTHRVSQIVKIFEHLIGSTKTSEEKKIQL